MPEGIEGDGMRVIFAEKYMSTKGKKVGPLGLRGVLRDGDGALSLWIEI